MCGLFIIYKEQTYSLYTRKETHDYHRLILKKNSLNRKCMEISKQLIIVVIA